MNHDGDVLDATDDADEPGEETPGQYLERLVSGIETISAKVNLKLAKLRRQKAWIFAEPRPPEENVPLKVRGLLATYVNMHLAEADKGFDPEVLDEAGRRAWVQSMIGRHGSAKMQLMVSVAKHLGDEADALFALTDDALTSPHYPYLRQVLDIPAYETRQVYFEQLQKAFLSVFVHSGQESAT
jgi:hypothetical protein